MLGKVDMAEKFDLVIIGSGISGLCAAKTYLQVNPDTRLVVYEAEDGLGGVWALDRIYPNLQTNNLFGYYEFSDFPASKANINLPQDSHIPGREVNKYLTAYAEHFNLHQCLRFRHRVAAAQHVGTEGWRLTVESSPRGGDRKTTSVSTSKLIVASGLCSAPQIPSFQHIGGNDFGSPIFHGKDMANRLDTFQDCKNVVVFGGTKMAWDAAYAYASAGAQVHWVIRSSGHGPCWMAKASVSPLNVRVEQLIMTRLLTWFSPCIWGGDAFKVEKMFRHLLQKTWFGRQLVRSLFRAMQGDVTHGNRYDRSEGTAKLKPWVDMFWIAGGQGVLGHRGDIFQMVADGKIHVHIDEITQLSKGTVHLQETTIPADALVCCTGWQPEPSIKFLPEGIDKDLGLPHYRAEEPDELSAEVDTTIQEELPILRDQPAPPPRSSPCASPNRARPNQPYRLYRFMAPSPPYFHERNLAFIGMQINFGVPLTVQAQSLWIAAYFSGKLPHAQHSDTASKSSRAELDARLKKETLLHSQFCRWRYPWGFGTRFPDFVFELMPYLDLLLEDLGLNPSRKMRESHAYHEGGWLNTITFGIWSTISGSVRETLEPYGKGDYTGITQEWLAANRK